MPSNPLPDSISGDELNDLLRTAPPDSTDSDGPLGSLVPILPLALPMQDAGALDLRLAIQQLLQGAGGAKPLQLLHATRYLLMVSCKAVMAALERQEGLLPPELKEQTSLVVSAMTVASSSIRDFAFPLTMLHLEQVSGSPTASTRKGLVSDEALAALGIDPEAYDDHTSGLEGR